MSASKVKSQRSPRISSTFASKNSGKKRPFLSSEKKGGHVWLPSKIPSREGDYDQKMSCPPGCIHNGTVILTKEVQNTSHELPGGNLHWFGKFAAVNQFLLRKLLLFISLAEKLITKIRLPQNSDEVDAGKHSYEFAEEKKKRWGKRGLRRGYYCEKRGSESIPALDESSCRAPCRKEGN